MSASAEPLSAASKARDTEQREARQEHDLAAVAVGQATAEDEQTGDDDVVRVDHPLQLADRGVEVATDERQREVDDRHVETGRERAEAEHYQRDPTSPQRHRRTIPSQRLRHRQRNGVSGGTWPTFRPWTTR